MKSIPKRFGLPDLAIESFGSQEGCELIDLVSGPRCHKSALQHAFMAVQQQFFFQSVPKPGYGPCGYQRRHGGGPDSELKAL
ncbi:hypothetical protein LGH82_16505 [Mesorhizobium sp. PAMC28654]|uniref:hypothetical protein n=1 Tax=Mesorhizobium sp. PAMC28654 TaxID=2880934 RepID=UPI001D0B65CB|nr:hypothetical protein [Mesorhizobium sp. PAMC28654]UDL86831.1 hypothetical protein LGH82_16505 [Mesorhizobium sp. PAMC28654]